eukprot:1843969-Pyramimonas_sp.AAC.1
MKVWVDSDVRARPTRASGPREDMRYAPRAPPEQKKQAKRAKAPALRERPARSHLMTTMNKKRSSS